MMRTTEVFESAQGEGPLIGTPSVFLRLYGCSLRCSWCDSDYTYFGKAKFESIEGARSGTSHPTTAHEFRPSDLVPILKKYKSRHLVITGGEPLLQAKDIITLLQALKGEFHVTIETNGMHYSKDLLPLVDHWSVSPKLPSSKMPLDEDVVERFAKDPMATLKFVIADATDLAACLRLCKKVEPVNSIVLQPKADPDAVTVDTVAYMRNMEWLIEEAKKDDWLANNSVVLPQLHVLVFGHKRGT